MVATAIALVASAQAAAAAAEAHLAVCISTMKGFVNDTASIDAARSYADCVFSVYGSGEGPPISAIIGLKSVIIVLKVALVLLFVGTAVGAWWGRHDTDGPGFGAVGGFVITLIAELSLVSAAAVIYFLFS